MSPSKFYVDDRDKKEMTNEPMALPLKINKESHFIQKSSSSSSSCNSSSSLSAGGKHNHNRTTPPPAQRHPVIIYTHSPKIIHTKARDFMALVQKLTGLSRSDDEAPASEGKKSGGNNVKGHAHEHDTSSSVVTEENSSGVGGIMDVHVHSSSSSSAISPAFDPPNPYLADVPLFTQNPSSDYFCTARPFYRYPDHMFSSPSMVNTISPSVLEALKGYPGPDYCT